MIISGIKLKSSLIQVDDFDFVLILSVCMLNYLFYFL